MSSALVALLLYVAFLLVAFGWRTWLQYRLTGDSGFRAASGAAARWVALLVAGAAASFLAPIAELAGWLEPWPWLLFPGARACGALAMGAGLVLTVVAQVQMGESWRIGVDPSEATPLVTRGLFRWVRNPIFTGMLLALGGLALAVPNALSLCGALLAALGLAAHVRFVEEPYLLRTHGERYRSYAGSTGRFVPGLGRLR